MATLSRHRVLALLPAVLLVFTAGCVAKKSGTSGDVPLVAAGKLTVCSDVPYEPFEFVQPGSDEVVGFDIDLIGLVAKDLGVKPEVTRIAFENIDNAEVLNTGKCDVSASAITKNPKREALMDMSSDYLTASQAIATKKGAQSFDLSNARGKTIGVQAKTTGADYVAARLPAGAQQKTFENPGDLLAAVKSGGVDGAVADIGVLKSWAKGNTEIEVSKDFKTGESYAFAVKLGNAKLLNKINEVILTSKQSGAYAELQRKWLGSTTADAGN
ncbi:amino acid ABC transporter substrate-binding protein [Pseudonocardiaceae bacterium YIM PH 21723]|nr:amino acid ABC transporter substrate-binding protein [Pseudonocardiaceae bacterium YIM PH 21723]